MTKMLAAVYEGPNTVGVKEVEVPRPAPGEALIRVAYAGICGSDMLIYRGGHPRVKPPLIMGHEFAGTIVDVNTTGTDLKPGDQVVVEPLLSCGRCEACRTGNYHVCQTLGLLGIDRDGGFAEYVTAAVDKIYKVPATLSPDVAALVEPVAVAVHAVRRSNVKVGDRVVVLGAGPIGQLVTQVLLAAGAGQVLVSELGEGRRKRVAELGVTTIDPAVCDPVVEVKKATGGTGADVVFEVVGAAPTTAQVVAMAKVRGEVVFVGIGARPLPLDLQNVSFKEQNLVGTRVYSFRDYEIALGLLATGKIRPELVVTHRLPLTEVQYGFDLMAEGDAALKILLKP
ncbi:zinc-binding dehydrogenase [Gelria sp. Kuro-4]|uniref:zinc-dependent alcohol dehydrogenase n=1 Tax=Gelria sp. Kuro-4 TaxID=2796927 RepID=UPI001BED461D|nr:alcohol dehydrogenase catalytic domain-containing protein [Gelria sp. Kuro-4]BCV24602.1 dehydrogenase [Gelria sp. Kuro-4]